MGAIKNSKNETPQNDNKATEAPKNNPSDSNKAIEGEVIQAEQNKQPVKNQGTDLVAQQGANRPNQIETPYSIPKRMGFGNQSEPVDREAQTFVGVSGSPQIPNPENTAKVVEEEGHYLKFLKSNFKFIEKDGKDTKFFTADDRLHYKVIQTGDNYKLYNMDPKDTAFIMAGIAKEKLASGEWKAVHLTGSSQYLAAIVQKMASEAIQLPDGKIQKMPLEFHGENRNEMKKMYEDIITHKFGNKNQEELVQHVAPPTPK